MSDIVRGVRAVAISEALKGALVLIAGFGLLSLVHHDLQSVAERLVEHLHLNPARHYPRVFIEAASRTSETRLRGLAALAFCYAALRFIEAYGLWHIRSWAMWFGIISGGIYFPVEIYEVFKKPTWIRGTVFLVNLGIVLYLVYVRFLRRDEQFDANAQP